MVLTVNENGMANIKWNYANKPDTVKTPYEIPKTIVDINLVPGKAFHYSDIFSYHHVVGA